MAIPRFYFEQETLIKDTGKHVYFFIFPKET